MPNQLHPPLRHKNHATRDVIHVEAQHIEFYTCEQEVLQDDARVSALESTIRNHEVIFYSIELS